MKVIYNLVVTLVATLIFLISLVISVGSSGEDMVVSVGFALLAGWFLDPMLLGWRVVYLQTRQWLWNYVNELVKLDPEKPLAERERKRKWFGRK